MIKYLIRKLSYVIPILIGVNLITFILFFMVNSPDDMARMQLGSKNVTPEVITKWKETKGYNKPLFFDDEAISYADKFTHTIFFNTSAKLFSFNFGSSDGGRDINYDISTRMWPSLAIAIPSLFLGLFFNILTSIFVVLLKGTRTEKYSIMLCIILMSISGLFYIIGGQFLFGKLWMMLPISGYLPGLSAIKFVILPVLVGIISGLGSGVRLYRSIMLEEYYKPYTITAKAKGLSDFKILSKHIFKNSLIPIITGIVAILPLLFLGSLITESFFCIPGLGSYTIEAIEHQDFSIIRAVVFLGTMLYMLGLTLTDITYTIVDPRIRLE
jgi:peptide/nickel transport system permease protein